MNKYDIIVIGGGHAGIEAAHAAAKLGSKILLVTLDLDKIGWMPCNPAIGGIGKGHLVFELSALGGLMPKLCSQTYLHARMLNTRKGPAVHGLRLQIDKHAYGKLSKNKLEQLENLDLYAGTAETILQDNNGSVTGVKTQDGTIFESKRVILTTGTFLRGRVLVGDTFYNAGRQGEKSVNGLSLFLEKNGLKLDRLKTGTPPRLLSSSIDFSDMEKQPSEELSFLFEFEPIKAKGTHLCYLTQTNEKTHTIIEQNLHKSALYSGNITGSGPRYCPSIEDKIGKFPDKKSHLIFVEPEDASAEEIYPNGISTSLPLEIQKQYVHSIKGFEKAVITKPGYAVEYDFVHPNQLHETLEIKKIKGLYLAGQINGTTGYEEAATQGLIAGINAHLACNNAPPFILDRTESYIGIMINDLVSMGVDEPYRMFTSRAERRLILRQDNAFLRLMPKAYHIGMISSDEYAAFTKEKNIIDSTMESLSQNYKPTQRMREFGQDNNAIATLQKLYPNLSDRAALTIHAEIRYEPYIKREELEVKRFKQYKDLKIPNSFNFKDLPGLSKELQEKLIRYNPGTIAQASLIPGMTPAAISLLIFKTRMNRT